MCGLRDISQRTVETVDGDVGSSAPYGIDCEDGVVGALDANGTVTGVLPGHWAGAPVDETNANVTRVWVCETPEACLGGADSVCRTGHEGVLCAGCLPGYTRSMARLCVPFDADEQSVAEGVVILSILALLFSALLGLAIALLCCRLARPPKFWAIVPPWMEKNGDAVAPKSTRSDATNPAAYDVWVHREADALVSFPFGESIAEELRRFGIDARVEPASSDSQRSSARTGLGCGQSGQSSLAREGPLMVEFGWYGLRQAIKLQRRFRALLLRQQGLAEASSPGGQGTLRETLPQRSMPPEDEMENAAVCLFCLTDNIFRDARSVMLIARAVKLGKKCELIV